MEVDAVGRRCLGDVTGAVAAEDEVAGGWLGHGGGFLAEGFRCALRRPFYSAGSVVRRLKFMVGSWTDPQALRPVAMSTISRRAE
mgnify:CR=1 FL=1